MPEPTPQQKEKKTWTWHVIAWSRRATAILAYVAIIHRFVTGTFLPAQVRERLDHLATIVNFPSGHTLLVIILITWYAYLTQLKIRWVLYLPIYLLFLPVIWVLLKASATVFRPLVNTVKQIAEQEEHGSAAAPQKKTPIPLKRLWVLLLFIWFLAIRGLQAAWAAWLLPTLIIPLWLWSLRFAYNSAVTPRVIANLAIKVAGSLLDATIKTLNEAKTKRQAPAGNAQRYFVACARYVVDRYQPERALIAIQREAILLFSAAFVLALSLSAAFWGLIARALLRSIPGSLHAYGFFRTGGWIESCLWAIGVMTTSIAFPGAAAPVWLKAIHASILLTGIFQLTYLLACFSITASAQAERSVHQADEGIRTALQKLDETKRLRDELKAIETTTTPPVQPNA